VLGKSQTLESQEIDMWMVLVESPWRRFQGIFGRQFKASLFHLSEAQIAKVVIAYEPIWAIGTGKTATTPQAQDMHAALRKYLAKQYGRKIANGISILYGGSCNAKNARELFAQPDVDGGLIGGASLLVEDFVAIINAF
jgi:triosephosphate isomerase